MERLGNETTRHLKKDDCGGGGGDRLSWKNPSRRMNFDVWIAVKDRSCSIKSFLVRVSTDSCKKAPGRLERTRSKLQFLIGRGVTSWLEFHDGGHLGSLSRSRWKKSRDARFT